MNRLIGASDVMEMIGCSRPIALRYIKAWNAEMQKDGYTVVPFKVPRRYAERRLGLDIEK